MCRVLIAQKLSAPDAARFAISPFAGLTLRGAQAFKAALRQR
jgi:hypothetical protein